MGDGVQEGGHVLARDVRLIDVVGGAEDEAGAAQRLNAMPYLLSNIVGCREAKGGLKAHSSPEGELQAKSPANSGRVHVIRLQRVDGVHTDLHQIADNWLKVPIAVKENPQVKFHFPCSGDDRCQAGLEEFAPGGRAHHHGPRHTDVVIEREHVDAGTGQRDGIASGQVGQPVEKKVCPIGAFDEVEEEVLQSAQPPGRLEELAAQMGQVAAGSQATLMQLLDLTR